MGRTGLLVQDTKRLELKREVKEIKAELAEIELVDVDPHTRKQNLKRFVLLEKLLDEKEHILYFNY